MVTFRVATSEQSQCLSDIAIESKGYWGYSREQLNIWRKDLHIEADYITENLVKTVLLDDQIIGFFCH